MVLRENKTFGYECCLDLVRVNGCLLLIVDGNVGCLGLDVIVRICAWDGALGYALDALGKWRVNEVNDGGYVEFGSG